MIFAVGLGPAVGALFGAAAVVGHEARAADFGSSGKSGFCRTRSRR